MVVFRGLGRVDRLRDPPGLYWTTRVGVALVYATTQEVCVRPWRPGLVDVMLVGEADLPEVGFCVVGHDVRVVDTVRTPSHGGQHARRARLLEELRRRGHV